MAVRGGKGGDPVAFSGGSGEGNGGGSGRGTATGASGDPYEGYDYEGEWADKARAGKLRPSERPDVPSSINYDGTDRGNSAEVLHHMKRLRAYESALDIQAANRPKTTKKVKPRVERISAEEKATFKGKRLENPTGTKEFAGILDLHSASIRAGLAELNAKSLVGGHGPRRLSLVESRGQKVLMKKGSSPVTSDGNLVQVNAAEEALAGANNHYAKYTEHRAAGDDFRFGTNKSGENPDQIRSSADTHKWYKKATASLLKAHASMNHPTITAAIGGPAPGSLSEDTITELQNKADKLPVQKVGDQPKRLQFGAKKFERHIREHLVKNGISEGSAEWTDAMAGLKGNIEVGSTIHKILIDAAKDYHAQTGDDAPLKKLTAPLKPVRKMTAGEKSKAKVARLGFGSVKGGTKTLEDLKKSEAAATEVGQEVDKPVSQILDETDHGIDTRIKDPKKESSRSTRTDRVGSAPIKGPVIGYNVTSDIKKPKFRPTNTQANGYGVGDEPVGPKKES